jgi:hypothetical protein
MGVTFLQLDLRRICRFALNIRECVMGGSEGELFGKTRCQRNAKSRGKTINKASWSGIRTALVYLLRFIGQDLITFNHCSAMWLCHRQWAFGAHPKILFANL